MKKFGMRIATAILVGSLAFAGAVKAQAAAATGPSSSNPAVGAQSGWDLSDEIITGRVQSVDYSKMTVTLAGGSPTLKLSPMTSVIKNGELTTALNDIRTGDTVRAMYSRSQPVVVYKLDVTSVPCAACSPP